MGAKMMKLARWSRLAGRGSAPFATFMLLWTLASQLLPRWMFRRYIDRLTRKLAMHVFDPYIRITFAEYSGGRFQRSEAFAAIESYLSGASIARSRLLKGDLGRDKRSLVLTMDENEEIVDVFNGVKVWWYSKKIAPKMQSISIFPSPDDYRYFKLVFHRAHRKLIHESYLGHVVEEGRAVMVRKRQRRLYTNNPTGDRADYRRVEWTSIPFEHPATFDTVAMDADKKQEIVQDLVTFRESKEYYSRIGKPWKRGYLLYGPPGTGKSSMIAAMANFMDYDVYDVELTAVKDNTVLRKLLMETTSKSITVIEDVDCSLNLTGKRNDQKKKKEKEKSDGERKVTLSGLLNSIDGLWSACAGERLVVFTTNYVDKLDPALIRRGRMDMHIELSYCTFQAFKVLAKNYLGIDDHAVFDEIKGLVEEKNIAPADVAENLMPKALDVIGDRQVDACLGRLVRALKDCKPKAKATENVEAEEEEATAAKEEELEKEEGTS